MSLNTRKIEFTIFGRIPSKKNGRRRIKRGNRTFSVPSEAHEFWEENNLILLRDLDSGHPVKECRSIEMSFYMPDERKTDLDNKATSILDMIVKRGILEDDNWQVTGDIILKPCGIDRKKPRAEVIITY